MPTTVCPTPGVPDPIASPAATTTYAVQVFDLNNCSSTDSLMITVLKKPVADAGPDKKIVAGQTVALNGSAAGDNISWYWTPPQYIDSVASLSPVVSPPIDFTYTLACKHRQWCGTATDEVFVRVFQKVTAPNAFSPMATGSTTLVIDGLDTYPESVPMYSTATASAYFIPPAIPALGWRF